jgi:hypothetical protein
MNFRQQLATHPDIPQLIAACIGAVMVGLIYRLLPEELTIGPSWLLLLTVLALAAPPIALLLLTPHGPAHRYVRVFTISLLAVLTVALAGSIVLLIHSIAYISRGIDLLKPAIVLWSSNVLVFGIWFWEMDDNGPLNRRKHGHEAADFQFPQQAGGKNESRWVPGFVDYLFLSFCTSSALSPADTVPLTRRAKLVMMVEAINSLLILVLLISRSINII